MALSLTLFFRPVDPHFLKLFKGWTGCPLSLGLSVRFLAPCVPEALHLADLRVFQSLNVSRARSKRRGWIPHLIIS